MGFLPWASWFSTNAACITTNSMKSLLNPDNSKLDSMLRSRDCYTISQCNQSGVAVMKPLIQRPINRSRSGLSKSVATPSELLQQPVVRFHFGHINLHSLICLSIFICLRGILVIKFAAVFWQYACNHIWRAYKALPSTNHGHEI